MSLKPLLPLLLFATAALSQGDPEDFRRSDDLRSLTSGKVFRDRIDPQWSDDGSSFWYRIDTGANAHHFVRIDAESGARAETEQPPGGDGLRTTVTVLPSLRTARGVAGVTSIRFINATDAPVQLFWVNDVDQPTHYHDLEPGGRYDQRTYAGEVWLAKGEDGSPVGIFEATETPGTALIDGTWKPGGRNRSDGRRERPGTSPDGVWSAGIDDHNVILTNTETGEEVRLTDDGSAEDGYRRRFWWSPDSGRLVVMRERPGQNRQVSIVESSPADQLQPKLHTFTYEKPGDRLAHPRPVLFDVGRRAAVPLADDLFPAPWSLTELEWAPDSSSFSFLYNQRGHQVMRVVAVDATTGEARAVVDEQCATFFCYSSKTYLRRLPGTSELIWMSERDGWNHLYLYDTASGTVRNQITRGEWAVRGIDRVDEEKRQIWFHAGGIVPDQSPYHIHYARINFDGSGLVVLTAGDGTHDIEFSPDGRFFIDRYSRVDLPPATELRRSEDGSLVCPLEEADWSELLATGWQVPERFTAKGRDGETDIHGVIYRPTTFDPARRYAVVEEIYAGPHDSHVPVRFAPYHKAQATAELGFIVVQIDGMGTSNRSKAFHDVCWKNLGDAGFPDRIPWMEAAAKERPWMDLERVGIYGGSAGGQNAMGALLFHHDFYGVAVADCGCHDNRMDKIWWNEQWMGYPVGPEYAAASNVVNAHLLRGDLLLIVGELDRNVDPASTMQVAAALQRADKPYELLVVPGKGHGAAGTPYARRRQQEFLVHHLRRHGG